MLGWIFIVEDPDIEDNARIKMWDGGLTSDKWLHNAAYIGEAAKIESHGGYPDKWLVTAEHVPEIVNNYPEGKILMVEVWDQS